jgi:2-hydroxychromene-2-carboxylate isomerase
MADVTFFFDPACPWTWRASRWLTLVAETVGLEIEWRPLSLWLLNDRDVPDPVKRARLETSHRLLRVIAQLDRERRQDDIARLYTATGQVVHENNQPLDDPTILHVLTEAKLVDRIRVEEQAELDSSRILEDESLDAAIEASTADAMAAAGPGVGSPVLVLRGVERGFHGPVLGAVPDKREALALWDAVETLAPITDFFEIKRGRS